MMQSDEQPVTIRLAKEEDFDAIWGIFQPIVAAGETYSFDTDCTREEAYQQWMAQPEACFVALINGKIVGTYYLKRNYAGNGSHVCNCGYMVSADARRRGIAALMCRHSQEEARTRGYLAMQFNSVVSCNQDAVRLWQSLGFEVVGRVPKAFKHPDLGFVDTLVMYRWLESSA